MPRRLFDTPSNRSPTEYAMRRYANPERIVSSVRPQGTETVIVHPVVDVDGENRYLIANAPVTLRGVGEPVHVGNGMWVTEWSYHMIYRHTSRRLYTRKVA